MVNLENNNYSEYKELIEYIHFMICSCGKNIPVTSYTETIIDDIMRTHNSFLKVVKESIKNKMGTSPNIYVKNFGKDTLIYCGVNFSKTDIKQHSNNKHLTGLFGF